MCKESQVAQVLELLDDGIESLGLNSWQLRTLSAIKACRTAALGSHIDACDACGNLSISYNSCRNRHCPRCQGHKREEWIQARGAELLPVPYFHVVFTLPQELNGLALGKSREVFDALFVAAWKTLEAFGRNKDVLAGMIAVLHTWGQNLSLHPHLHCIVPGGGIDHSGNWKNIRSDGKFLFPVKALSKVFRAKYVATLAERTELDKTLRQELFKKDWVVYARKPLGSAKAVIEYLGRYTHKVAISNSRIQQVTDSSVNFSYKDYKAMGERKVMTLTHGEFVRRFAQHILPKRFVKIRHYGFLSSNWKRQKLKDLQRKLKVKIFEFKPKTLLRKCPCCKEGNLITIELFAKRGPPDNYLGARQNLVPCKS